ncbi:MAG: hypothetical protein JWR69_4544 [Pedosphaera sp.]|nr:hypothetical protein [Pedosphaera sp.]
MTTHTLILTSYPWLIPLCIALLCRVLLLGFALWILLRMQSLNYNIPGLLGSATLASAFDLIPFVGHYVAVAVLLLCLLKLTRAHIVDVRFTVAVSYAVMFLMQMLILSALPGDLRAHARTPRVDEPIPGLVDDEETDAPGTNDLATTAEHPVAIPAVNQTPTASPVIQKPTEPVRTVATKVATPNSIKLGSEIASHFKLNGVVRNARESMAMINTGVKTYTITMGESMSVETPSGRAEVSLEQLTGDGAVLKVGGEPVSLRLR